MVYTPKLLLTSFTVVPLVLTCSAALHPSQAGTLNVLHGFTGGADGATPYKGVTADSKGNLYGETFYGADACPDSYLYANVGCGTVYRIDPSGTLTTLVTFSGAGNGADGNGNLTLVGSKLYGTAYTGGPGGQGTIFSVSTSGKGFKLLHSFNGTDGQHPNTFPRFDAQGNLFSDTKSGGPGFTGADNSGFGVLYEITQDGTFIPQHDFSGGADGGFPGRLFFDASGNIFGSAAIGGSCSGTGLPAAGCGVLFEFTPFTGQYTVIYTFKGQTDGYQPLLSGIDKKGNLFGASVAGGASNNGVLWELKATKAGYKLVTLHAFTGGADGEQPVGTPLLTSTGDLIGTTLYGPVTSSNAGYGVLFSYSKGTFTTLYTFSGGSDGGYPESTPTLAKSGAILGTTAFGGTSPCNTTAGTLISVYGCGVVFSYTP